MKKLFYVVLALLMSMVLVFGVSCDNSNKAPGGAEGNPPAVDVPGEGEEGSGTEEPGTGEEPGGEEGTENPGEGDDPKPEEPGDEESGNLGTDAVKVPGWADGDYTVSWALGDAGKLKIENGGFLMNVNALGVVMDVSTDNIVSGSITYQNDSTNDDGKNIYNLKCTIELALEEGQEPSPVSAEFEFVMDSEDVLMLNANLGTSLPAFTCNRLQPSTAE